MLFSLLTLSATSLGVLFAPLRGLLGPFWLALWGFSGSPADLLGVSFGQFAFSGCFFATPWAPGCAREVPKRPQERPPNPPEPPGGIKKASPSSKSRFLLLCAEGVAGDAPQALSIRPPPRGRPCWMSVMRALARILSLQGLRAFRRTRRPS